MREYDDARELYSMDGGMEAEIIDSIAPLKRELDRLEEEALFSGDYDAGDAVVTLQSDVGGTDAQDFTEMLLRMYERWAQHRGFRTEMVEASPGEEAGLKSATFTVEGENAYGILRAERGKHRLVRLSPFDQAHRRHTSFAQVIPAPLMAQDAAVEIDENDLRIDTYRAQGAGGQHVNKTDSAVRITHLPTGVVVQCQNERSQAANKQTALRILKARLAELAEEEREEELATSAWASAATQSVAMCSIPTSSSKTIGPISKSETPRAFLTATWTASSTPIYWREQPERPSRPSARLAAIPAGARPGPRCA
jgi:peptide chain release factor 2